MTRLLLVLAAGAVCLSASSTASWEMSTFTDFVRGRFTGLSLSREGRITVAPRIDTLFASDQPAIWAVAHAPDGSLYAGTGHRGRVYRVNASGKSDLLWTAPQSEVFALAVAPDGAVYAGTSPDGKVFRISASGTAQEYFDPQARYIWSLLVGPDGVLYVGTGDNGKIFKVSSAGRGELWYETGQSHVTALELDAEGRVLAGSEPNGVLYRILGKDKAFVLYDSTLPEIRTVIAGPDGSVYAAALGGSVAGRAGAAANAATGTSGATAVTAPATSITVADDTPMQTGLDIKPKPNDPPKAATSATVTLVPGSTVYSAPAAEITGVEKSALYRINADGTVETLWSSREENIYDLLPGSGQDVLFSTDAQGRIYRLTPDRRVTLLAQTNEGETTRLVPAGDSIIAATGTSGKLLRLGGGPAQNGAYESPVHDAGSVARWGQISWRGQKASGDKLVFRVRAGNSARPDRTWSEWSEPLTEPNGSTIATPNARFVQWRAEMSGDGASFTGVTLSYLPQNNPPMMRAINVVTQIAPSSGGRAAQATTGTYSVTVTDTGDAGPSTVTGTPTQTVSRGVAQQIQLSWQADDPDGDRLVYAVWFRGEEERDWKLLRTNFAENLLTLEGDVLADGKYFFRVVVSDRQSNPAAAAREADLVSAPVLFDNTPPLVRATATREGTAIVVTAEASDATSSLRRAEYSVDAAAWMPLEAADGVVDGRTERFTIRLDKLSGGEHLVVVRAFDSSQNAGLAKVVVQ